MERVCFFARAAIKLGRHVTGYEINANAYAYHMPLLKDIRFGCDLESRACALINKAARTEQFVPAGTNSLGQDIFKEFSSSRFIGKPMSAPFVLFVPDWDKKPRGIRETEEGKTMPAINTYESEQPHQSNPDAAPAVGPASAPGPITKRSKNKTEEKEGYKEQLEKLMTLAIAEREKPATEQNMDVYKNCCAMSVLACRKDVCMRELLINTTQRRRFEQWQPGQPAIPLPSLAEAVKRTLAQAQKGRYLNPEVEVGDVFYRAKRQLGDKYAEWFQVNKFDQPEIQKIINAFAPQQQGDQPTLDVPKPVATPAGLPVIDDPAKTEGAAHAAPSVPDQAEPVQAIGVMELDINKIEVDESIQSRVQVSENVVKEYANGYRHGTAFPAVVVFYDGKRYWAGDGFHRFGGATRAGKKTILADVRPGTKRDAMLYSVGANAEHGLRRTKADKRRAVRMLLNDPDWTKWTDREIGRQCQVSHTFVAQLRIITGNVASDRTYINRWGKVTTIKATSAAKTGDKEGGQPPAAPVTPAGPSAGGPVGAPSAATKPEGTSQNTPVPDATATGVLPVAVDASVPPTPVAKPIDTSAIGDAVETFDAAINELDSGDYDQIAQQLLGGRQPEVVLEQWNRIIQFGAGVVFAIETAASTKKKA